METADEALVAQALTSGAEAFAPIVHRYQSAVFGVALARVRDFHEAEDITQAVFVDAFLQLERLQEAQRLGPWLRTMAIHKAIDRLRRRREHVDVEQVANDPGHAEMPEALQRDEVRERVLEAVGRLAPAQRETITLHYLGGYSVREIAAIQGAPEGTVKARLHHGRKALKRDMMEMVEKTLTSESPGEDLAQRVFEALSRHDRRGQEIYRELRQLGAGSAIEGFVRASKSESPEVRRLASYYAATFAAEDSAALEVVESGLRDPNRNVRGFAVRALGVLQCSDEVMRRDFLPLACELLFDPSLYVRQRVSGFLEDWAADVPLATAARALLEEKHAKVRPYKEDLLRQVLLHQDGEGPTVGAAQLDERIRQLRERLDSQTAGLRTRAAGRLLLIAMRHPARARQVVPIVQGALTDRSKKVRWRAAQELLPWAAEVDAKVVAGALQTETNASARAAMERLLEKAQEQSQD